MKPKKYSAQKIFIVGDIRFKEEFVAINLKLCQKRIRHPMLKNIVQKK